MTDVTKKMLPSHLNLSLKINNKIDIKLKFTITKNVLIYN